jgi:hypothetical protein
MPFLFVDYDQGAGGERFCAGLSESPECERLQYQQFANGRTKVHDVFDGAFLAKSNPTVEVKKSHPELYTVIPTHRRTDYAKSILEDVYSIRIRMPTDPVLHDRITEHRINKVLLSREPQPEYFFGELKILSKFENNRDFIKKVKRDMRNIDLVLLSQNKDPTPEAVEQYLQEVRKERYPEPDHDYDLVIPYEQLAYQPEQVKQTLSQQFGITVTGDWLATYA